jgi:hypothetical protein
MPSISARRRWWLTKVDDAVERRSDAWRTPLASATNARWRAPAMSLQVIRAPAQAQPADIPASVP